MKSEFKPFLWILGIFLFIYFMPIGSERFDHAVYDALALAQWYAREHVILCLIPAFFIAGIIAVFVSKAAVLKYFGAGANKWLSYGVASVSGSILAVCSCTILPLFSGIYKRGAGLGPATAFLYAGPAVNIMAIILTARILGLELGIARVAGAVLFSIVIGLIMQIIYRRDEQNRAENHATIPGVASNRPVWQTFVYFLIPVLILVAVNFGKPAGSNGVWAVLYQNKWPVTGVLGILFSLTLVLYLKMNRWQILSGVVLVTGAALIWPDQPLIAFVTAVVILVIVLMRGNAEAQEWLAETWGFTRQIMPLLAAGVLAAGFLLGANNSGNGIIPNKWIAGLVGGNSLFANFFASIVGAFMYFATLTEVPILQGLISSGMGKGPALALLLAGPALSLPNMLVIRDVMGTQKTIVYVSLVVVMASISGMLFGWLF